MTLSFQLHISGFKNVPAGSQLPLPIGDLPKRRNNQSTNLWIFFLSALITDSFQMKTTLQDHPPPKKSISGLIISTVGPTNRQNRLQMKLLATSTGTRVAGQHDQARRRWFQRVRKSAMLIFWFSPKLITADVDDRVRHTRLLCVCRAGGRRRPPKTRRWI